MQNHCDTTHLGTGNTGTSVSLKFGVDRILSNEIFPKKYITNGSTARIMSQCELTRRCLCPAENRCHSNFQSAALPGTSNHISVTNYSAFLDRCAATFYRPAPVRPVPRCKFKYWFLSLSFEQFFSSFQNKNKNSNKIYTKRKSFFEIYKLKTWAFFHSFSFSYVNYVIASKPQSTIWTRISLLVPTRDVPRGRRQVGHNIYVPAMYSRVSCLCLNDTILSATVSLR